MKFRHLFYGLLLCGLWALFASVAVATELKLSGNETSVQLAPLVETFEDKSANMSIEELVHRGRFALHPALLRPGHTQSAIWLKFDITNASTGTLTRWLDVQSARLREVSLFLWQEGQWQRIEAGTNQPLALRPVAAANAVFPIELQSQEKKAVYLRVASPLPVTIVPTLWDPLAFRTMEGNTRLIDGLMLGGLTIMVTLGMLLLFLFRDRAFLFIALATLTFCLAETTAKGYSLMTLWPEAINWVIHGMPIYPILGIVLNIMFLRDILSTHRNFPRIDRLLLVLMATELLPVPGILLGEPMVWAKFSFPQHLPITVVMVLVGIYAITKGVQSARYYTAGYAILALGSLIHGQAGFGIQYGFGSYALPISMLLNNLLLLASAVNRIILIRKEKEKAQNALLDIRATHEAELERTVANRTSDLNMALTETRKTHQAQSRLVAYIGHDLRAPLATIVNYVKLLGQRGDEKFRHHQATIERCATHQLELIDDLVEYARGELDHLELVPTPTYLHDWLNDIANQAELLSIQYNNYFELKLSGEIPPVAIFDPKRLRQVLINLLQNSAKFTSEGKISLVLHATPSSDGKVNLAFAVKDTGAGIPQEDMERIFLPFEQRKSERVGSGLGLTIAKKLVRAMGSDLTAESTPGKGSSFNFHLSIKTTEEAYVQHHMQAFTYPEPFGTGKTLLIADDNAASRDYLYEVLTTANFETICVPNGTEALHLAQKRRFDAILIDQLMPDMSGWEVLSKLHESSTSTIPPFILCSAMLPMRPEGFPAGIDFYTNLLKPVDADNLLRTMQSLFSEASPSTQKIQITIPNIILNPLRDLITNGCVTDIETWASSLEQGHPEHADFAHRVQDAARQCDLIMLTNLVDMYTNHHQVLSKNSLEKAPTNTLSTQVSSISTAPTSTEMY